MVIGVPALNQHQLTEKCLKQNEASGAKLVVMDNGSEPPYESAWTYKENVGYFYPLKTLYKNYKDPIIGLMHNDVLIYDNEWPMKVLECFERNPKLGMVGLAGWGQIDYSGNVRDMKANFLPGSLQDSAAVKRVNGLDMDIFCLDSLFLAIRSELVPLLHIDEDILPYHWYDKIWSLILLANGYKLGVLGIQFEHIGGQTALQEPKYIELALEWCRGEGIHTDDPDRAIFKEGKKRFEVLASLLASPS